MLEEVTTTAIFVFMIIFRLIKIISNVIVLLFLFIYCYNFNPTEVMLTRTKHVII